VCGISGILAGPIPGTLADIAGLAGRMADTLTHRGPDDRGVWADPTLGIALAHRRLSILDLSPAGHQPMASASGRFTVAFNGEVYNHVELRRDLERAGLAPAWRGHSDTEVLLAACDAWGLPATLIRLTGMFAIAMWDRAENSLCLARDRLGEKPLYYGLLGGHLVFASELKALRVLPWGGLEVDRDSLALMLRFGYVPTPHSIYRGIGKLPPGCWLRVPRQALGGPDLPAPQAYWSAREVAERCQVDGFAGDSTEATHELERVLGAAVASQMHADVPLGAFLSGGIDSSVVVALMQARSERPVQTFTIGFHEAGYDEAQSAKAVAAHLGTAHTELYVTPADAMGVIADLPYLYDEPFADSSQIPTFLVARLARSAVTVSLSGDGGDELFGGYNRYSWARHIWRRLGPIPPALRRGVAAALTGVSPAGWNRLFRGFRRLVPPGLRYANPGDKLHKLADILAVGSPEALYLGLVSFWRKPSDLVIGAREPATPLTDSAQWTRLPELEHRMMYLDLVTYLPDDILVKVDRAAMGVSLETRVPLLDHRVVEFAWRLPLSLKIREGQGKWLLRQVLYRYVPPALVDRPKMGFGVPIDHWLRGPLKPWAEALIEPKRLKAEGYFNPGMIRQKWLEHQSGRRNWAYYLWDVLMFQAWLEAQ
jgi:asparagine synthase (glutamine-hydrolysing)